MTYHGLHTPPTPDAACLYANAAMDYSRKKQTVTRVAANIREELLLPVVLLWLSAESYVYFHGQLNSVPL